MNNQRKLTKKLSIVGLFFHILGFIAGAIFAWLFLSQYLKIIAKNYEEELNEVKEILLRYLFLVIIISAICIAKFVILIILAVKTTSIINRRLFIIGIIFIGFGLHSFIGLILELRNPRKSDIFSNQENPQMPSNNSNSSIPPMPQY